MSKRDQLIDELIDAVMKMPRIQVHHNRQDYRYLDVTVVNAGDFERIGDVMSALIQIDAIREELAQQPEPPVTDATFAVGDRVQHVWRNISGAIVSEASGVHGFCNVRDDDSGTVFFLAYHELKHAAPVIDERATWQVRHRVDLMAFAYEVYKPDENYVINRVACSSTPIYLCGCGRYDCEHVDAVKAYIEAQAAASHSGFKWDGHNWQPIAPKAASDGAE